MKAEGGVCESARPDAACALKVEAATATLT